MILSLLCGNYEMVVSAEFMRAFDDAVREEIAEFIIYSDNTDMIYYPIEEAYIRIEEETVKVYYIKRNLGHPAHGIAHYKYVDHDYG